MIDKDTKALIQERANDFLDIRKWDVITTCAHYGITPTQLYCAPSTVQRNLKVGKYDADAYHNLGLLNSLCIPYALVQNIFGRDLGVRYTEILSTLAEKGLLEVKPRGVLLNKKHQKRVSFGIRYLPPLDKMEAAYSDLQQRADIIAKRGLSKRALKYIAKICAMRKRETPAGDTPA